MKFSIIVPIYNVELYLAECIESILNQTYQNYEIICIDDASKDKSYEILLEYAKRNDKIKVLRNECNHGLSYTRNRGIDVAKGEYILFVDSDDMLRSDALCVLNNTIEKYDVEMVCYRLVKKNEGKIAKEQNFLSFEEVKFDENVKTGQEWFLEMAQKKMFVVSSCLYLLKRDFLLNNNLKFYEGILHEDILHMFQCAFTVSRMICIHEFLYICRKRDYSITSTVNELRLDSFIIVIGEILNLWRSSNLKDGMDEAIMQYMAKLIPRINRICLMFPEHDKMGIGTPADQFLYDLMRSMQGLHQYYIRLNASDIEKIRKFDKIIIFGAGDVAAELIVCLKNNGINIDAVAVSDKSTNVDRIAQIKVVQIDEIVDMRENAVVIIGVSERKQASILKYLEDLEFKNIMCINTD